MENRRIRYLLDVERKNRGAIIPWFWRFNRSDTHLVRIYLAFKRKIGRTFYLGFNGKRVGTENTRVILTINREYALRDTYIHTRSFDRIFTFHLAFKRIIDRTFCLGFKGNFVRTVNSASDTYPL